MVLKYLFPWGKFYTFLRFQRSFKYLFIAKGLASNKALQLLNVWAVRQKNKLLKKDMAIDCRKELETTVRNLTEKLEGSEKESSHSHIQSKTQRNKQKHTGRMSRIGQEDWAGWMLAQVFEFICNQIRELAERVGVFYVPFVHTQRPTESKVNVAHNLLSFRYNFALFPVDEWVSGCCIFGCERREDTWAHRY